MRRGLSGEIIGFFSRFAHPKLIIAVLIWTLFLITVIGLIRLIILSINILKPLWVFGVLFFPAFLLFFIFDHGAFGRKEILGFPFLLLHLFIIEKIRDQGDADIQTYYRFLPILTVFLLPLHILFHESTFLLFVPVHIILSWSFASASHPQKPTKQWLFIGLSYLPVLVTFLAVTIFGQINLHNN